MRRALPSRLAPEFRINSGSGPFSGHWPRKPHRRSPGTHQRFPKKCRLLQGFTRQITLISGYSRGPERWIVPGIIVFVYGHHRITVIVR